MPTITIEHIECAACHGTGLYKGACERDGAAVVCSRCKGTGETVFNFTYEAFTGRKDRDDVTRVFPGSYGYALSDKDVVCAFGRVLHYPQYGCSYEDWKKGAVPVHMKELYCPYSADNRGIGNEPLLKCTENRRWGGLISDCPYWDDKAKCWEMYENKKAEEKTE